MGTMTIGQNNVRQVNSMPVNNVSSGSVQQRKTTNVTSDTDTYSCTYINEKIGNIENILNTINSGSGV